MEEFDTMPCRKLLVQVEKVGITTRIIKDKGLPIRKVTKLKLSCKDMISRLSFESQPGVNIFADDLGICCCVLLKQSSETLSVQKGNQT